MTEVKKESELASGIDLESEKPDINEQPNLNKGVHSIFNVVRNGKYSSIGYNILSGPVTQAERWNMPFMDPEFDYEPTAY